MNRDLINFIALLFAFSGQITSAYSQGNINKLTFEAPSANFYDIYLQSFKGIPVLSHGGGSYFACPAELCTPARNGFPEIVL